MMRDCDVAEPIRTAEGLSLVEGIPLSEECGIGALTLGGYLREVTTRYGDREAAVMHSENGIERWSYGDLWLHSFAVAQALLACGVGKGTHVGVLMTNRLEFLSSVFGIALAGGVAAIISPFSTPAELESLLQSSCCSVLLLERNVFKKDFAKILAQLESRIAKEVPGNLDSLKFPFLRYMAMVDCNYTIGAIEGWQRFLQRGTRVWPEHADKVGSSVSPADPAMLFFSHGSTGKPKGILSAHRGVCLQLWRWRKWFAFEEDVRSWSANGFFWSGNFAISIGGTLSAGGALVLQRSFQAEETLKLMEAEEVSYLLALPHQWGQLTDAKNWLSVDLSALRYIDMNSPVARHPSVKTRYREPSHTYGTTETFTLSTAFPANTPREIADDSHGKPLAGNTIKIVNPLTGKTMPRGEKGEIAVKGPTLMLGYLGIPLDESVDSEGFFRTGDAGLIDKKGRLHCKGRLNARQFCSHLV